jgi:CubicO group peptidase (beta-lactamase class C family)
MGIFKLRVTGRMAALMLFTLAAVGLEAQIATPLTADQQSEIDSIARKVMEKSGIPSASLAVVKDGKLAYAQAYGKARLEPPLQSTTAMPYSIGSISKQFTAAAILMLQEEGKLSLDDKIGKWLPDLTRANEISIRQLLSMTSGYQDFWPQDYVMRMMMKPTTAEDILNGWARKPLDFDPGTKTQYSNTNYVNAGLIVEKVSGKPLYELLQERVLAPAGDEQRPQYGREADGRGRSAGIFPLCFGAASSGAGRGCGMDVCSRRAGDDADGPGEVGHLCDG